ncbi:unnamed protein product, partial [Strongylus vulgaris]
AHRFGVEHIVWKCELYLKTKESEQSFDLFQKLVFATKYKMASLETDCLAELRTANDVRLLLDDPRLEQAPKELRPLLLETLLQRFKSDTATPKDLDTSRAAQNFVCNLFKSVSLSKEVEVPKATKSTVPKQEQSSVDGCSEVTALRNELKKQEAMRHNLEMSLKVCFYFAVAKCSNSMLSVRKSSIEKTSFIKSNLLLQ